MKSNKELLVSLYRGCSDNLQRGTHLDIVPLYDVLFGNGGLEGIDVTKQKGQSGSIFAYVQNELGLNADRSNFSDGIVFIDIDKLTKNEIATIYDKFELLCSQMPNILSCWYSHSYYNADYTHGGMHFVINASTETLDCEKYKYFVTLYGAILARVIHLNCGIEVRPTRRDIKLANGETYRDKCQVGLDSVTKSVAQRFFLNHSTVKWNDNAYAIEVDIDKQQLRNYVNEFETWWANENQYKVTKCQINSKDISFNGNKVNLGYRGRITVLNTLAYMGVDHAERVALVMSICGTDDYSQGEYALRRNVEQCSRTAEHSTASIEHITHGIEILKNLGYDINAEIEKIYQPIDYQYDSIFEEVWESMKDYKPTPKNYCKINLKSNEYLTDYKHEITDMINQYEMTYLVADCMVGKTTYALNMQNEYGLFDDEFIVHFKGDSIDVCVPYNSVADNKAKGSRKDVKRVKTADLSKFSIDKRNVFIWNTVMPLYEQYFKTGLVKRLVLFFDESQKIVTDDYRWETVFEMFKVLPSMYRHFVFMTGTPAGELEYLKQYFNDYCIIKVDKEIDYKRECKILKYKQFGCGDRIKIIEDAIADGRLPLIYSNSRNYDWREACGKINKRRVEEGLRPYKILDYSRPNADRLGTVNRSNSIKEYDIVIATKYCSVGIDFNKDDKRMRTAIIDFASEKDCTFHDIWQFTLRNRNQDTITKIIVHDNEMYYNKLYNYWYYVKLFDDMSQVHTYKMVKPKAENDIDSMNMAFAQEVFQARKFGKLVSDKNNYFDDDKNVKLLAVYYLYVKIFGNINVIKHMLQRRGVTISEIDMEHIVEKIDYSSKKEVYNYFVDNFDEISKIHSSRREFEDRSYQIDINSNDTENITDGRIYSRNMHYMDWLIGQFAGKNEWLPILQTQEYITKETFTTYNRMALIARKITKKEIDKIKRLYKHMIESDLDDLVVDMVDKHYAAAMDITKDEIRKAILLKDIIEDYKRILKFAIDNIEFIEEIKDATDDGQRIAACHKMKIAMDQKQMEQARKKMSTAAKKAQSKSITVRFIKNSKTKTFDSMQEAADYFKVSTKTFGNWVRTKNGKLSKVVQLIELE